MRKYFLIITLLVFVKAIGQSAGQNVSNLNLSNLVPPSPSVAALLKFDEMSVNFYTGIPNISEDVLSMPIDKNLSINLKLDYHPTGVRIEEYATWVGTGWSLSGIGGFISRSVKGAPDDYGGFLTNNYPSLLQNNNFIEFDRINYNNVMQGSSSIGNFKNDTEADVFHFNFMGNSGKFIFSLINGQLVPKMISTDTKFQVKVIYSGTFIQGFVITDELGYVYTFMEKEITNSYTNTASVSRYNNGLSLNGSNFSYSSSWHLTNIKNSSGKLICSFNYLDVTEKTSSVSKVSNKLLMDQLYLNALTFTFNVAPICGGMDAKSLFLPYLLPLSSNSITTNTIQTKKIKQIIVHDIGSKIEFVVQDSRNDYDDNLGCSLSEVLLFDKNQVLINKVEFDYSYIGAGNRLFLNGFKKYGQMENGSSQNSSLNYTFSYQNPHLLPLRTSYNHDLWGYFNNKRNFSPYPAMSFPPVDGADMTTNPIFVKTGVLNKIVYPNGGVKEYEFESNTFHKSMSETEEYYDIPENKIIQNENLIFECTPNFTPDLSSSTTHKIVYLHKGAFIDFNLILAGIVSGPQGGTPNPLAYKVMIRPLINNYPFDFSTSTVSQDRSQYSYDTYNYNGQNVVRETYSLSLDDCTNGTSCSNIFYLQGFYLIDMVSNGPNNFPEHNNKINYNLKFNWFLYKENYKFNYGGGLRIKSVTYKNNDTDEMISRKFSYKYNDFQDYKKSSGSIIKSPVFHYYQHRNTFLKDEFQYSWPNQCYINPSIFTEYTFKYLTTVSNSQTFLTQGSLVGYKNVEVTDSSEGSIKYYYNSPEDFPEPNNLFQYPYSLDIPNNDFKRGLLLKEEIFDVNNKIQKETLNQYIFEENVVQAGFKCFFPQFSNCGGVYSSASEFIDSYDEYMSNTQHPSFNGICPFSNLYQNINIETQSYKDGWAKLNKSITNEYFYKGNVIDTLVNRIAFDYNNYNKKISKKIVENSLGEMLVTEYFYPMDTQFAGESNAMLLVSKNIISYPLLTRNYNNGEKISEEKTIYKNWYTSSSGDTLLAPELILTSKGAAALEERIKYNAIDVTNGNPLEVQRKDGMKISYIWGYNHTQPVAKLENIAYLDIPSNLITAIQNATDSTTGTQTQVITALNALRTSTDVNLQKAMITTLTYKPLVGVTSVTDPRGQTTTYEYDGFGRLERVKDHQGNILSENEYHYRTQN